MVKSRRIVSTYIIGVMLGAMVCIALNQVIIYLFNGNQQKRRIKIHGFLKFLSHPHKITQGN